MFGKTNTIELKETAEGKFELVLESTALHRRVTSFGHDVLFSRSDPAAKMANKMANKWQTESKEE